MGMAAVQGASSVGCQRGFFVAAIKAFSAVAVLCSGPVAANGLSNDTSTFTGNVVASCSMPLGDTTQAMTYVGSDNRFWKTVDFSLTANQAVRLSISAVSVQDEPQNIVGRYAWARIEYPESAGSNGTLFPSPNDSKTGKVGSAGTAFNANNQTGVSTNYQLNFQVGTSGRGNDGKHQLLPGDYSYQVTVSCLQ